MVLGKIPKLLILKCCGLSEKGTLRHTAHTLPTPTEPIVNGQIIIKSLLYSTNLELKINQSVDRDQT